MLNCKQGDLAIIVKSTAGNEGKIVRCLKFLHKECFLMKSGEVEYHDSWECDTKLKNFQGGYGFVIQDSQLRPIRDPGDDAQDEMLKIVGKPVEFNLMLFGF